MQKFLITENGYAKLRETLENLKNHERPKVIQQIAAARELGDLRENAEYHSAKEKQGFIEAQIADYEDKINRAEIVYISKLSGNKVVFGVTVLLDNGKKEISYQIVSDFEANLDLGLISANSPVAKALLGKEVGDEIEINTPGGIVFYEILSIKFV
ncbi:MAG: transcription elongation factor GreA [Proteobacteria bacterium]|nr:transcription elongation factor GreA [Pseudomonadota bacterium]